jgi:predicted metal-dependent peptidase
MNTKDFTPQQILAMGRGIACKYLPFFETAIYNLIPNENPHEPTLSVTKRLVLNWNPNYVKSLGPKLVAGVIVHEINHVLRQHHKRFEQMLKRRSRRTTTGGTTIRRQEAELWQRWNKAADLEINDGQPPQVPLPRGVLYPKDFGLPDGKLCEWYFKELSKQEEEEEDQDGAEDAQDGDEGSSEAQDADDGDDGDDGQDGSSDGSDADGDPSGGRPQDGSQGVQDDGPGCGHCGSCAGPPKSHEPDDGKLDGELGRSDAELDRIRDQVAEEVVNHVKQWGRGSVANGLLWWAQDRLKPPTIRWQEQLDTLTRQAVAFREGFVDWRDDIIDEQQGCLGWGPNVPLLPRLVAPVPEVMFLVDRSFSMSSKDLEDVAREVPGVLQHLVSPLQFGAFDDGLREIKRVSTVEQALKLFKGGGGTNFHPIFEYLKKPGVKRPDVLIIGTDGCGPAPVVAPQGISVIWLLVGKMASIPSGPKGPIEWGTFIWTDPERRQQASAA